MSRILTRCSTEIRLDLSKNSIQKYSENFFWEKSKILTRFRVKNRLEGFESIKLHSKRVKFLSIDPKIFRVVRTVVKKHENFQQCLKKRSFGGVTFFRRASYEKIYCFFERGIIFSIYINVFELCFRYIKLTAYITI